MDVFVYGQKKFVIVSEDGNLVTGTHLVLSSIETIPFNAQREKLIQELHLA